MWKFWALLPLYTAYVPKKKTFSICTQFGAAPHQKCKFFEFSLSRSHKLRRGKNLYIELKFSKNFTFGLPSYAEMRQAFMGLVTVEGRGVIRAWCKPVRWPKYDVYRHEFVNLPRLLFSATHLPSPQKAEKLKFSLSTLQVQTMNFR